MSGVAREVLRPPGPRSPAEARRRRRRAWLVPFTSLGLSLALHAAVLLLVRRMPMPPPKPEERVMELSLVAPGDHAEEGALPPEAPGQQAPAEPPSERVAPRPPRPRTAPSRKVPTGRILPPAPGPSSGTAGPPEAAPPSTAPPTSSFSAWQKATRSKFLPKPMPIGRGGSPEGTDLAQQRGYDRCVPPSWRHADVLFLLFDASGSMTGLGRAQALSCAQQYATASLEEGSTVVVGTFARESVFSTPTRRLLDVQAALRAAVNADATVLPSVELGPLLDQAPGATADLVIVSDGYFLASPEVLNWYRYFLDLNPDNRATMYTVGAPGHRDAVAALRKVGFEVFVYDELRGVPPP